MSANSRIPDNARALVAITRELSQSRQLTDVINVIREHALGLKVSAIALTALADHAIEQEALLAGFDLYLTKPVQAVQLSESVKQLREHAPMDVTG